MDTKVLYVERKPSEYVSIEKVFRQIAASLSSNFNSDFQQMRFGFTAIDTFLNLLFFRRQEADIYHVTGHVNYAVLRLPAANTVLTFHDLRFLRTRGRMRRFVLRKLLLDWPVRKLKYITAISEHTKKEIVENTGCDPRKILRLDVPLFDHFRSDPAPRFNKERPVVLQVGTLTNKNVKNLAFALAGIGCKLRIIGSLSSEQIEALNQNKIDFENLVGLDNKAMFGEYSKADIVTFCSTYEGFGLPIIEAQAVGRVVVTSKISPLTETAGGAAEFVDPNSIESIRNGILKVINDDDYRAGLIDMGSKNAERFRSNVVARQYEDLYNEINSRRKK
jgi:glycosyltransferase involved in cell wall biosynthesis